MYQVSVLYVGEQLIFFEKLYYSRKLTSLKYVWDLPEAPSINGVPCKIHRKASDIHRRGRCSNLLAGRCHSNPEGLLRYTGTYLPRAW